MRRPAATSSLAPAPVGEVWPSMVGEASVIRAPQKSRHSVASQRSATRSRLRESAFFTGARADSIIECYYACVVATNRMLAKLVKRLLDRENWTRARSKKSYGSSRDERTTRVRPRCRWPSSRLAFRSLLTTFGVTPRITTAAGGCSRWSAAAAGCSTICGGPMSTFTDLSLESSGCAVEAPAYAADDCRLFQWPSTSSAGSRLPIRARDVSASNASNR